MSRGWSIIAGTHRTTGSTFTISGHERGSSSVLAGGFRVWPVAGGDVSAVCSDAGAARLEFAAADGGDAGSSSVQRALHGTEVRGDAETAAAVVRQAGLCRARSVVEGNGRADRV